MKTMKGDEKSNNNNIATACDSCRKMKIKCDYAAPCAQCQKHSRLCIYSPRKRRGPPPKYGLETVLPITKKTQSVNKQSVSTSFVIDHYLQVLLGHMSCFFHTKEFDQLGKLSTRDANISNVGKLQLFSALSCSARSIGNLSLSNKLFEQAREMSRLLYDDLDKNETEDLFSIAIGFTLLALASCAYSRRKAAYYISIARSLCHQHDGELEENHLMIQFMVKVMHFHISPFRCNNYFTFPLDSSSTPMLTQFFPLPISRSSAVLFSRCLAPISIDTDQEELKRFLSEYSSSNSGFLIIEFVCFVKAVACYFSSEIRHLFECDELKEEYCFLAPGVIPRHISLSILTIIEQITRQIPTKIYVIAIALVNIIRALLFLSLGNLEQGLTCVKELVNFCLDPENYDKIILGPPFAIVPGLYVCIYWLLVLRMPEDANRGFQLLATFEKVGFLNAVSGKQVLMQVKNRMYPPQNPSQAPLPEDSSQTTPSFTPFTFSSSFPPPSPSPFSFSSPQAISHSDLISSPHSSSLSQTNSPSSSTSSGGEFRENDESVAVNNINVNTMPSPLNFDFTDTNPTMGMLYSYWDASNENAILYDLGLLDSNNN